MNKFGLGCDVSERARPEPAEGQLEPAPRATAVPSAAGRRMHILLLDDDVSLARVIAVILTRVGYEVDTAEDGEQGWAALNRRRYDLLLTDNDMPRLKGLALVRRIRAAGMTLPIIVLSGSDEVRALTQEGLRELTAVVDKPFHPEELIAQVERAVPAAARSVAA